MAVEIKTGKPKPPTEVPCPKKPKAEIIYKETRHMPNSGQSYPVRKPQPK